MVKKDHRQSQASHLTRVLHRSDTVLTTLKEKPELVGMAGRLVPHTVVAGSGTGLEGVAAMLPPSAPKTPTAVAARR